VVASNSLPHLLEKAGLQSRLSADALDLYLGLGFIPAPYCIIEGVHKVAPGTTVTIDGSGSRTGSFLPLPEAPHDEALDPETILDQLEERLVHSLSRVTEGEDRIRLLLSGGIDSSLLGWLVTRLGRSDITTVCIDTGADDSITRAQQVAGHLRIQHKTFPPPPFSFERLIHILEHLDEPIADSMIYPLTYLLEELASSARLCITGIGADSLFGGLNTHLALDLWANGGELSMAARERLGARPAATVIRELEILRSAPDPIIGWTRIFTLLSPEERAALTEAHRSREQIDKTLPDFVRGWFGPVKCFAGRALRFDAEVPMADSTLQVVRQAARFAGVTYDTPFLTAELFGFSRQLPRQVLIRDSVGKVPLRRLLQQRLPSGPWQLPKIGFRLPLDRILETHRPTVEEILHSDKEGIVNQSLVRQWLHEFYSRQPRNFPLARKIWSILMWELWCRTHSVSGPTTWGGDKCRGPNFLI
jgi:asparagine synthase (glutamine-hydrolysing)